MLSVYLGNFLAACGIFIFIPTVVMSRSALLGHFAHPSSAVQGNSISSTSLFCLCSQPPGQEATYLSWCGPEPLLNGLAGNSLAAAGAVWLLGLTGLFMARSHWRKCGTVNPTCFRPPQQLQLLSLMVCSTQGCLNSYFVSLTSALLWLH